MDFQKVRIIEADSLVSAGVLPLTHAIPKLWRVPDSGFSYRKSFGPIKIEKATCAIPAERLKLAIDYDRNNLVC